MNSMTLTLLGGLMAATIAHAAPALDESVCRDGYSTMLLTQNECEIWLSTRSALEKRGNANAVKQLDEQMRDLLAERAETCPCAWDQALKEKMLQKSAGF